MRNFDSSIFTFFALFAFQIAVAQVSEVDTLAARGWYGKGISHLERSSFDSALHYFQRSSELWKKNNVWKEFISAERGIVEAYIGMGWHSQAYEKIIQIENQIDKTHDVSFSDEVRVQVLKSYLLSSFEKYDEALSIIRTLFKTYPSLEFEQSEQAASAYYTVSSIYHKQGIYDLAVQNLEKAKHIREQLYGAEHLSLSRIYISFGHNFYKKNDFHLALQSYSNALHILEVNNRLLSSDAAYCHQHIMSVLIDIGGYQKAIEHGKRAVELYSQLRLSEHSNLVGVLQKLGEIYTTLGDLEKAKEYTERSLSLALEKIPYSLTAQAILYNKLADIYRMLGNHERALEYSLKGISLAEKSYGADHPQTGLLYELAAGVYVDRKEFRKAIEYYHKALAIRKKVTKRESFNDIVSLHLALSNVYQKMGMTDSSYAHLLLAEKAESQPTVSIAPLKAMVKERFGEYYQSRQRYAEALQAYRAAMAILNGVDGSASGEMVKEARSTPYKKEAYRLAAHLAEVYEAQYRERKHVSDLSQALQWYITSIDLVDDVRRQYSADASKFILAEQNRTLYTHACRAALQLYQLTKESAYQEQALLIADRSKANALLEQLFDQEAKRFAGIPDSLLQQENELLASIVAQETQLQKTADQSEAYRTVQAKFFDAKTRHQQFVEYLEKQYPRYYELKYAKYRLTVSDIRRRLGKDDVLIEYMGDSSSLFAFALSNDNIAAVVIPRPANVSMVAEQFVSSLKKVEPETYYTTGKQLYTALVKPFEKILSGKRRLIVAPDGVLHYVPFEALPAKNYQADVTDFTAVPYLIRYYDVTYSYSAAFTVRLNEDSQRASLYPSSLGSNQVLSFVGFAPVFRDSIKNGNFLANRSYVEESGLSELRSITMDGKTFNELKFSEDEVLSISRSFQSHTLPAKNFLYTSATETNFKLFSSKYDVVHVATHGFMNEKNPKLSAILFSQPREQTETDDGILYLNETYALDLKAKLVVLSSCESGVGAVIQGEGMMALTRGLFYAGAKNIIFSLWKVPDRQTYLLMDEFYKQMLSGKSYASSLREAKLTLIAAKESAFPSKWSGFVLMGE